MRANKILLALVLCLIPVLALGDPSPLPSDVPVSDGLDWLRHLVDMIPGGSWGGIGIVTVILDMLLRIFKTDKPRSVIGLIASAMHILAAGLEKVADLIDSVLGNRTV